MIDRLLVIVPSRGRPASIGRLWDAWQVTTAGRADLLVCLDDDDPTLDQYPPGPLTTVAPRNGFAPRLTAEAVDHAVDYWALASWGDDHLPRTFGWDADYLDTLDALGTGFVYGDDLFQGADLPTACAMTSDIVRALGWMTPPGMAHLYVDDVWRDLGRAADAIRYLPDTIIEHLHPAAGKAVADDLLTAANSPEAFAADRAVYESWQAEHMEQDVATIRALREAA